MTFKRVKRRGGRRRLSLSLGNCTKNAKSAVFFFFRPLRYSNLNMMEHEREGKAKEYE
jgi:hypothetical protein